MSDGALSLFESLSTCADLDELIAGGEAEGLHLECKAPAEPRLTRDLKAHLAKAVSGFSNTAGGLIIWGISTTQHAHSGLDVLTQLEPIANCRRFEQQVKKAIPSLTTPAILGAETKVIKEQPRDTRGVVLAYIPRFSGDPVQSNIDDLFWFRSGDEFQKAPYEMIKRLFASSESPDIRPILVEGLVEPKDDGFWEIPIILGNSSNAVGEHVLVSVEILNPSACAAVSAGPPFRDVTQFNPGRALYTAYAEGVVYRGMNKVVGSILVKMGVDKLPKRALRLRIVVYANRMRARAMELTLHLAKSGLTVRKSDERFLY